MHLKAGHCQVGVGFLQAGRRFSAAAMPVVMNAMARPAARAARVNLFRYFMGGISLRLPPIYAH